MSEANIRFEEGHFYTRLEIRKVLGGSMQECLPTKQRKKKVVCACLQKTINPYAPDAICCGMQDRIMRTGEILSSQPEPIPIFIKHKCNKWEYRGMYEVDRVVTNLEEMTKYSMAENGLLSRVILMKRVKVEK